MNDDTLQILLIEDSATFRRAVAGFLEEAFQGRVDLETAGTLTEGLERLQSPEHVSVVLLDLILPDSEGIEGFQKLHAQRPDVPVVVLTGLEDEQLGLEMVKQGAQDYLIKKHVNSDTLHRTLCYAVERSRAEYQSSMTRTKAVRSTELKSQFLATMSHEMRTPMNGIVGMSGLLLGTNLDSEQREYAQTISLCAESLLNLINDILDFSKIEAGKLTFESIAFDLREMIGSAAEMIAERAESKGVELVVFIERDVPTIVRGDPTRLRQVLLNLVSNAVKFTDRGTVVVRAERQRETDKDFTLRFSVRDTGMGIPPEAQAELFSPFVQADGSTTRKFGGTGLGLAICKQLVEGMKGQIEVESSPGSGSTFSFALPLEKPETQKKEPAQINFENVRAVIVDHSPANTEVLQYHLKSWKVRTTVATTGQEALTKLYHQAKIGSPYELALIDTGLADMSGVELAQRIHDDPALRNTSVILMCPFTNRPDSAALRLARVSGLLAKPILFPKLTTAVQRALDPSTKAQLIEDSDAKAPLTDQTRRECRVLLAEDNAVNQKLAVRLLDKFGYSAEVVENGIDAVDRVRHSSYDLILMDCQMPEMDGYQATTEIRKLEGISRHTSIIAMTANAMTGDREKCLEAGMDDYLAKPVQPAALKAALDYWAAQSRTQKAEPKEVASV
jgi:signal transduction histidine kinase